MSRLSRLVSSFMLVILVAAFATTTAFAKGGKPPKPEHPKHSQGGGQGNGSSQNNQPTIDSYNYCWINLDGSYTCGTETVWHHATKNGYMSRYGETWKYYDANGNEISQSQWADKYHVIWDKDGNLKHYSDNGSYTNGTESLSFHVVYSNGRIVHDSYRPR